MLYHAASHIWMRADTLGDITSFWLFSKVGCPIRGVFLNIRISDNFQKIIWISGQSRIIGNTEYNIDFQLCMFLYSVPKIFPGLINKCYSLQASSKFFVIFMCFFLNF